MKKLVSILLVLMSCAGLFAQMAKSTGLTDKDVKNFAKNYEAISEELEKLETWGNGINPSKKDLEKVENILGKYGISGPNRFDKAGMIGKCTGLIAAERSAEFDEETIELMKSIGMTDPFSSLRVMVNQADYLIVKDNFEALSVILEEEDGNYQEEKQVKDNPYSYEQDDSEDDADEDFYSFYAKKVEQYENASRINLREFFKKKLEEFRTYEHKLTSSSKDVGMLCKKYDSNNASKYKLVSKNKPENMWSETGIYFKIEFNELEREEKMLEFYFDYRGINIFYRDYDASPDSDCILETGDLKVSSWNVYTCEDGGVEVIFYTDKAGPVHLWSKDGDAILENSALKLNGNLVWSAG